MKKTASTLRSSSISKIWILFGITLLAGACREGFVTPLSTSPTTVREAPTGTLVLPSPTIPPSPVSTLTATPGPAPAATASPERTAVSQEVCSPLQGYTLEQIPSLVSNPFHPPSLGSDEPHAGVDLADLQPGSRIALTGRPVQAVLKGVVAAVVADRFPFGNALIVETPLSDLESAWAGRLGLPEPYAGPAPHTNLTCPASGSAWKSEPRSLYLLYAHLMETPSFKLDDPLSCGQGIGKVGMSGNALNPHLHLEVRVGPAGARFESLSHYDNRATQAEMAAYCVWSVSGEFLVVDPLKMFFP